MRRWGGKDGPSEGGRDGDEIGNEEEETTMQLRKVGVKATKPVTTKVASEDISLAVEEIQ